MRGVLENILYTSLLLGTVQDTSQKSLHIIFSIILECGGRKWDMGNLPVVSAKICIWTSPLDSNSDMCVWEQQKKMLWGFTDKVKVAEGPRPGCFILTLLYNGILVDCYCLKTTGARPCLQIHMTLSIIFILNQAQFYHLFKHRSQIAG